jgi:tRNA/tmRNA/rRNA uracil-C5-methylase (TrmA/RlmC/RlmD family)
MAVVEKTMHRIDCEDKAAKVAELNKNENCPYDEELTFSSQDVVRSYLF